jgi:hypothetical protein
MLRRNWAQVMTRSSKALFGPIMLIASIVYGADYIVGQKCSECQRLLKVHPIATVPRPHTHYIHGSRVITGGGPHGEWASLRILVSNAGPPCSKDPLLPSLAADSVSRDIQVSNLAQFGASASVTTAYSDPNVLISASGPSCSINLWAKQLLTAIERTHPIVTNWRSAWMAQVDAWREAPRQFAWALARATFALPELPHYSRARPEVVISAEQVRQWRVQRYRPSSFTFALSGADIKDVVPAISVLPAASQETFSCNAGNSSGLPFPVEIISAGGDIETIHLIAQTQLRNKKAIVATEVANRILGMPAESRLRSLIRERYGLSYEVDSRFFPKDLGRPWIITVSTPSHNFSSTLKAVARVLRDLALDGPSDRELLQAKLGLVYSGIVRADTPEGATALFLEQPTEEELVEYAPKISNDDVKLVIRSAFFATTPRVVAVGDEHFLRNHQVDMVTLTQANGG